MTYKLQTNDLIWWWEDEACNRVSPHFQRREWAVIWFSEFTDNDYKEIK